jgi:anti-sigma B factor antagonist
LEITKKELYPGVAVIELSGSLQMGVECKRLELAFDQLIREKRTRVILDLSQLSKVDSGGIGRIVNCLSRLKVAGGTMHVAGANEMVCGVLKMTRVDRLVKIYPTALEASQNFAESPTPPTV